MEKHTFAFGHIIDLYTFGSVVGQCSGLFHTTGYSTVLFKF